MACSVFNQLLFVSSIVHLALASSPNSLPTRSAAMPPKPPMGWKSVPSALAIYDCEVDQNFVYSNAQALQKFNLVNASYQYVIIDCGYIKPLRDSNGNLIWDTEKFPDGAQGVKKYLNDRGLSFGITGDGGQKICRGWAPGSLGNEIKDATEFKSWGIDLLDYKNCYSDPNSNYREYELEPITSPKPHYQAMDEALGQLNHSIIFQVSDFAVDFPAAWGLGSSWQAAFPYIITEFDSIRLTLNQAVPQISFATPGRWLDLGPLLVGANTFSIPEEQTQFSLWAILKSPLIIIATLNDTTGTINNQSLAILLNKKVIGYNQDKLGVPASFVRRWTEEAYEVWAGPLDGGRTVAAIVNLSDQPQNLTLDFPDIGFQSACLVYNVWNDSTTKDVLTSYSNTVQGHGTLLLELQNTSVKGLYDQKFASAGPKAGNQTNTTYYPVYGMTTSVRYSMTITFTSAENDDNWVIVSSSNQGPVKYSLPAHTTNLTVPIALLAKSDNSISIISPTAPVCINVTVPKSIFYPSWTFAPHPSAPGAELEDCVQLGCFPVGNRISRLGGPDRSQVKVQIPTPYGPDLSGSTAKKFINIYFCNNDIAYKTPYPFHGSVTSTRNLTLHLNDAYVARVELPLSGRSSELFSPDKGWSDTGVFGLLLDGWKVNGNMVDNINWLYLYGTGGAEEWSQTWTADIVGIEVFF